MGDRPGFDVVRRFRRSRNAVLGGTIVSAVVLVALFARFLAPYSVEDTDLLAVWGPPSSR